MRHIDILSVGSDGLLLYGLAEHVGYGVCAALLLICFEEEVAGVGIGVEGDG